MKEFNKEVFTNRLKMLRKYRGFTRYELSIQADLFYQYYCNIESGRQLPTFKGLVMIANALGTTITNLTEESTVSPERNILLSEYESKLKLLKNKELLNEINIIVDKLILKSR